MEHISKKTEEKYGYLFRAKTINLILSVRDDGKSYVMILSKRCGLTYSHTVKVIYNLEKVGILKRVKEGRIIYVRLTEKGKELKKSFIYLNNLFKGGK